MSIFTSIKGQSGRLLWGSRTVIEFGAWEARPRAAQDGGGFSFSTTRNQPDPVYWEHHGSPLTAELEIGRGEYQKVFEGTAQIISREPLSFVVEDLH